MQIFRLHPCVCWYVWPPLMGYANNPRLCCQLHKIRTRTTFTCASSDLIILSLVSNSSICYSTTVWNANMNSTSTAICIMSQRPPINNIDVSMGRTSQRHIVCVYFNIANSRNKWGIKLGVWWQRVFSILTVMLVHTIPCLVILDMQFCWHRPFALLALVKS